MRWFTTLALMSAPLACGVILERTRTDTTLQESKSFQSFNAERLHKESVATQLVLTTVDPNGLVDVPSSTSIGPLAFEVPDVDEEVEHVLSAQVTDQAAQLLLPFLNSESVSTKLRVIHAISRLIPSVESAVKKKLIEALQTSLDDPSPWVQREARKTIERAQSRQDG